MLCSGNTGRACSQQRVPVHPDLALACLQRRPLVPVWMNHLAVLCVWGLAVVLYHPQGPRAVAAQACSPGVVPQRGVWGGVPPVLLGGSMADRAHAVAVASNGDVVIAGETDSYGAGRLDILIVRLDGRSGGVVWARVWGGIYDDQNPTAIVFASNGDVVLTGFAVSFTGSPDVFVLRLDGGSGSVVWARAWWSAPANNVEEYGLALTMMPNGDVVVVGATAKGVAVGNHDVLVMRLVGNSGELVWASTWGGSNTERAYGVSLAASGELVVAGWTNSFGSGTEDVFVLRVDSSNGTVLWARTWGGTGSEAAFDFSLAPNGDVILAGYTTSSGAGGTDVLVLRLSVSSGAVAWARSWGGSYDDLAYALTVASNGDVVVAGYTKSFGAGGNDALLLRLNSSTGDVVWARTWGSLQDDTPADVAIASNGNVVIAGGTLGLAQSAGNLNAFVLAVNLMGSAPVFPTLSSSALAIVGLAPGAVIASAAGAVTVPAGTPSSLTVNTNAVGATGIDVKASLPATVLVSASLLALSPGSPSLQVRGVRHDGTLSPCHGSTFVRCTAAAPFYP